MLVQLPHLEPKTLLLHIDQTFYDHLCSWRKRKPQRCVEQSKALHGSALGVMFLQHHQPGAKFISDLMPLKGEPINVAGVVFDQRLFHLRLPYSGWCHVELIRGGKSFLALAELLLNALEACGGVPAEHRTNSLSSCFRNRDGSYAGDYNCRYREFCAHLGVIATRNNLGTAHDNGVIDGLHRHWKHRHEQPFSP